MGGLAVTFGTARRGLGGLGPRPVPFSLYQMMARCSEDLTWRLKG